MPQLNWSDKKPLHENMTAEKIIKKYRQKANFCPVQHFLTCVTLLIQYSETDFRQMVCCIIYSIIL